MSALALVAGGGGFIGGHLVKYLRGKGTAVRAVDLKPIHEWHQLDRSADNRVLDLRCVESCYEAVAGAHCVYNLACDMGGMGFIENNKALCMLSVLINTHLLMAARDHHVGRYFYSSSACVYDQLKQRSPWDPPLKESDAYPARPEDGYGWEKLFSERMCRHFREDFDLETRVARYHNVYGPFGTWAGGREKAPAAICRKVAEAAVTGKKTIEIWGDGQQTRSFMYVDDCLKGTVQILESDIIEPINLGSPDPVSISQLVDVVESIAGVTLDRRYNTSAPRGVSGRNSDNTMIKARLGWEPSTRLIDGLRITYRWVYSQVLRTARVAATA